jgi:hypothetical protein
MKQYVLNLIPRLKLFSESLDKKEIFLEKPWVFVDDNGNHQKYIFSKNGNLIMSLNGQVTMGKWEYLSSAKSLLIDRIQDKILLNQAFVDPAIMILKKDGQNEDYFFLANELLIPDLNITDYIRKAHYSKHNILGLPLKDGKILEIMGYDGYIGNNQVSMEGVPIPDGFFESAKSGNKYWIKDSKIHRVLKRESFTTDKGEIVVEIDVEGRTIRKGDLAFQHDHPAIDGKYRLGFMHTIIIENGRVIKT